MRRSLSAVLVALALIGCDSQIHMTATPQLAPITADQAIRATAAVGAGGTAVSIDDPSKLPSAVRMAADLKAAVGTVKVPVTRLPNGSYVFTVPAGTKLAVDVAGNLEIMFVMDDRLSQQITLNTGSPVQFAQPPVQAVPATLARGLDVVLTANTTAPADTYQFTWNAGTSANGPWTPIPGEGKQVKWTPAAAGNYYLKVDAVNRQNQQSYSSVTPSAVVFVLDPKDVITSTPTSGAIARGDISRLKFNQPLGLTATNATYAWSYGASANGPWQNINGSGDQVDWQPTAVGSYFVKTEVSNKDTGTVNTFVSPQAVVFVSESRPIITADKPITQRGERINLALNVANPGKGPFAWFIARGSNSTTGASAGAAAAGSWTPLSGTGSSISTIATDAGVFNFRVDIPQTDGSVKSFTTTDPVLNVLETTPLIHSDPPFDVFDSGGSSALVLEAKGVDETYRYLWYLSLNPAQGWTSQPINQVSDLHTKRYNLQSRNTLKLVPGSYFARVDATSADGSVTYTFTSSSPVITITNAVIR
ncbi:MAG: hypothetical protein JWM80_2855 [Cyanobacteria bacterium RYN_339]|nr:hypothetical protein [Cyanobacteria bacterium RYN_339]